MNRGLVIGVDFDGTVLTHENFPDIGRDIGAVPVLKRMVAAGHKLVLWTVRSDSSLETAVKWFEDNDIELHGINELPGQCDWSSSPKCSADIFIDDRALGAPLIYPKDGGNPYINWTAVYAELVKRRLI